VTNKFAELSSGSGLKKVKDRDSDRKMGRIKLRERA